jgi:hypothetical protein
MALFTVGIEYDELVTTPTMHAKLMGTLMRAVGERHRLFTLPKHFQQNANTQPGGGYGYTPRSKAWSILKAKRYHTQTPLVATGRMRSEVLANSKVTATQYKATVRVKNYFPMIAQRRKELEAVTPAEVAEMAEFMKTNYLRLLKTNEYRRKKRVKR